MLNVNITKTVHPFRAAAVSNVTVSFESAVQVYLLNETQSFITRLPLSTLLNPVAKIYFLFVILAICIKNNTTIIFKDKWLWFFLND